MYARMHSVMWFMAAVPSCFTDVGKANLPPLTDLGKPFWLVFCSVITMVSKRQSEPMDVALLALMTTRGLTETELAAAADVTPATVSRYLSGHRGRSLDWRSVKTVEKLAAALAVDPEYFLEYRQAKAERLVKEAMGRGDIDLEDIELILEGKRYAGGTKD